MSNVWVLNTTDELLRDGYDGKFYDFAPGRWVEVPDFVATHVFGDQQTNKEPYLIRLGWTKTSNDLPEAYERLSKFVISSQPPQTTTNPSPVVGRIPPSSEKREGGKGIHKAA